MRRTRGVDIIGTRVYDADDRLVGRVHDIRITPGTHGTPDAGKPAYVITGLIVGPAAVGTRLGYGHGRMAGPWPMTWIFRWLAGRSVVVDWSDVVEHGEDEYRLRKRAGELRSLLEVDPLRSETGAGREGS
ncbi:MAG: PRC-barrel domain-containing protein [Intrasporangium sp.]